MITTGHSHRSGVIRISAKSAFFSTNERSKGKEEEGKGERENGGEALAETEKVAGEVSCLGGSMVQHQLRLLAVLGSIPGWCVCDFFPFLPKLHFHFPFSFPFLFLSLSLSLRPFVCAKNAFFAFIPIITILSVCA